MPSVGPRQWWQRLFDTTDPDMPFDLFRAGHEYPLLSRSMAAFRLIVRATTTRPRRARRPPAGPQAGPAA
jgi:hypothetical protein